MPRPPKTKSAPKDSSANFGFESRVCVIWLAADKLRNNMDAAEPERSGDSQPQAARRASEARQYKHVVLGLILLSQAERDRSRGSVTRRASRGLRVKYISDSFDEHHGGKAEAGVQNEEVPGPLHLSSFRLHPSAARWAPSRNCGTNAKLPSIGKDVDDAMVALERDNPRLKGALNKNYGRADLDKHCLGEPIDLIGSIQLADIAGRSKDLLGRVFEYFLTQFASAEGKNGGQFYTPSCVVRLLVEMLAPYKGRIYDPACGSGEISIYGQDKRAQPQCLFGLASSKTL